MMPTIRIDDDVFAALKALAEPFVDTPNSVIKKLLEGRDARSVTMRGTPKEATAPVPAQSRDSPAPSRGELTPQPMYEQFLLYVLAEKSNGRASKRDATTRVIHLMKARGLIGPAEEVRVSTGETRAENTVAWGRNALKERGLIRRNSPIGIWELTEEGIRIGKNVKLPSKR